MFWQWLLFYLQYGVHIFYPCYICMQHRAVNIYHDYLWHQAGTLHSASNSLHYPAGSRNLFVSIVIIPRCCSLKFRSDCVALIQLPALNLVLFSNPYNGTKELQLLIVLATISDLFSLPLFSRKQQSYKFVFCANTSVFKQ